MLNEISIKDALGKIFVGYSSSVTTPQCVLVFQEIARGGLGTFVTLTAEIDRHEGTAEIRNDENLDFHYFSYEKLLKLGITTEAEIAELTAAKNRRWHANKELHERKLLKELKKKYGE